jgi:anti-sigma factor RsiW
MTDNELERRHARRRVLQAAGAVALGAALGTAAVWTLPDPPHAEEMLRDAAVAHAVYSPEMRHPVEVAAADKAYLQTWLSQRLGMKVEVPDLEPAGLALVGGRLLPGKSRPVAVLMYQARDGRRASLYWVPDFARSRETALLYAQEHNVRVFYWLDHECGYALVSHDIGKEELGRIAATAYELLEK